MNDLSNLQAPEIRQSDAPRIEQLRAGAKVGVVSADAQLRQARHGSARASGQAHRLAAGKRGYCTPAGTGCIVTSVEAV